MVNKNVIDFTNASNGKYTNWSPEKYDCSIVVANDLSTANKYSIEDAIKETGHGKFHILLLFVCGFGLMGVVVENVNIGLIIAYVRCDMNISTLEQGLLSSVGYLGIVLSSHIWGFLADTWGRHKVLKVSLGGSFIFASLSAFSLNIMMLIITRLCVGIFVAGVQAATYSYIGEFHSNKTRTQASAFVAMFMPACFIYLPLIAMTIIPMEINHYINNFHISSWRLYLLCSSLLNLFNFICMSFFPESPKFLLMIGKEVETLEVLKRMYMVNTGNPKDNFPVKALQFESTGTDLSKVRGIFGILKLVWNQTWPLFVPPHVGNTIKLCYLMFILFAVGHGTFMWFPDFLTQMQNYTTASVTLCSIVGQKMKVIESNSSDISIETVEDCAIDPKNILTFQIILIMGITFVTISAIISFYINKIKRKILLTTWLSISAIVCALIAFIDYFYIMVICFMIFLSAGLCAGIISAISVELFPTNYRAMATCLILMLGRVGAVGGSNFVSSLLHHNCELMFYLYSGLICSCIIVCFFLNTNSETKTTNKIEQKTQT